MTAIIYVNFKTKERTYSVSEHPEYLQEGKFVKKNNSRYVFIDPKDIECLNAYMIAGARVCHKGEEPTMLSKSYFDQRNNEDK